MTLADIKNIKKDYGSKSILRNVSFEIKEGDIIGLVGLNGAGKTTLAGIIFGSVKPDGGTVRFYRKDIKIGYLMQSTSYTINAFNEMTAGEAGTPAFDEFIEVSGRMGLKDVHRWSEGKFSGLSGGERTKLALANMWVTKPDLLILDEPTNHMDFLGVEWLIEQMGNFKGAALVISHDRYMLEKLCSKLLVFEDFAIKMLDVGFKEYMEASDGLKHSGAGKEDSRYTDRITLDNRIAFLIGKLSTISPEDPQYLILDMEFKELVKKKNSL